MANEMTLAQRCAAVDMLVMDVDGVLTDGGIVYADDGTEIKTFHVRDGSGLKLWQAAGKRAAIISGRKSPVVDVRAAELGVTAVLQGIADKLPAFQSLLEERGLRAEQACFVGDDLADLSVMRGCGLAIAVADACPEVRSAAQYVTQVPGGRGAVRETVELVLRCQGKWHGVVERTRNTV